MIIFNLISLPINDYTFVFENLGILEKNIRVVNLNISKIYFKTDLISSYSSSNNFSKKKIIEIKTKRHFFSYIESQNNKNSFIFCLPNYAQVDDFWLLRYFKLNNYRYFIGYKVNPLPKKTSQTILRIIVQLNYVLTKRLILRIKQIMFKYTEFYKKPLFLITSGNYLNYWAKHFNGVKLISINSPQINWHTPNFKNENIVYVDEFTFFRRDSRLLKFSDQKINGSEIFYSEINQLFNMIEKIYNQKVLICCSNKHKYINNPYGNRKIIYGKTLDYISKSSLVIGHDSDALFQAIYLKKKILLFNSSVFTSHKTKRVINFSIFFRLKYFSSESLIKKDFKIKVSQISIVNNDKIIKKYFKSSQQDNNLKLMNKLITSS